MDQEGVLTQASDEVRQPLSPHGKESLRFKRAPCNDVIWAILFYIQLIVIIVFSVLYYSKNSNDFSDAKSTSFVNSDIWVLVGITAASGIATAILWIFLIRQFAYCLIWFSLILCVVMWIVLGILFIAEGVIYGAIIAFILAALQLLWMYCVRNRIAFTAAILQTAISAINTFASVYLVSFFSIFVQAIWTVIWMTGFAFVIYDGTKNGQNNISSGLLFLFLLAFYWTSQVIANIVLVTCCGVVATWYFLFPQATPSSPVFGSLKRATWNSFGSICFGSFLVALLQTLRAMLRMAQNQNNALINCVVMCILACIENLLNYFNLYAFARIAIYGQSYCDSARDTWQLFITKGVDAVINDDLSGGVLILACFFAGACSALVTGIVANIMNNNYWVEWAIIGFVVGFVLTLCATIVIKAGVVTIFVCFSEDPASLAMTKPQSYQYIIDAWRKRFGKIPNYMENL